MNKKIFLLLAAGLVVCIGALSSCGISAPSPEEVMEKITANDKLEVADYQTMLDYLEDFVDAGEASENSYEAGQQVAQEYPYFMAFANKLDQAPDELTQEMAYKDVMKRFILLMSR